MCLPYKDDQFDISEALKTPIEKKIKDFNVEGPKIGNNHEWIIDIDHTSWSPENDKQLAPSMSLDRIDTKEIKSMLKYMMQPYNNV